MSIDEIMALADEYVSASIEAHGYRSGAASAEYLEDTKRKLLAALESLIAAPAAPQQAAHNAREINNLVGKTDSQQAGPVWMRPDQLQKARHAPFLCRVSPTKDAPDLMPMFLHPPAAPQQAEPVAQIGCARTNLGEQR